MVVDTEDEVYFEEFIESCQVSLCLARDGLLINDGVVSLDDVLFTNTQEEGLSRFNNSKGRFNTGSHLQHKEMYHDKSQEM